MLTPIDSAAAPSVCSAGRPFGEDVTNELVEWFNSMDATYKADLRELKEANFGRFDGKLGERLAELRA